jgi:GNAT superfamily N-acetyltransferase
MSPETNAAPDRDMLWGGCRIVPAERAQMHWIENLIRLRRSVDTDGQLSAHFRRLGDTSQRSRFGGHVDPCQISRYVEALHLADAHVIGCTVDGTLRGIAELHVFPLRDGAPRACELSVSVEPDFQSHRIGTRLTHQAVRLPLRSGIDVIQLWCDPTNAPMRRIASAEGAEMRDELCLIRSARPTLRLGTAARAT